MRGRQVAPGVASVLEQRHQLVPAPLGNDPARRADALEQVVEHAEHGMGVVAIDVGPDRRAARRDAGHVPEPPRRQSQQRSLLHRGVGSEGHQRRRGQVGDVADDGDEGIVALGLEGHDLGAERGHERADERVGSLLGRRCRGEHPRGAIEQIGVRPVGTFLLRPGHRVTAHETWMVDGSDHRPLHAADVGHHQSVAAGRQQLSGDLGDGRDRCGHDSDVRLGVAAEPVDCAELEGARRASRIAVLPAHLPARAAQREAER